MVTARHSGIEPPVAPALGSASAPSLAPAIARLAERLPRIGRLQIAVDSRSENGWSGRGQGEVVVRRDADGAVRFLESGTFELDAGGVRLPFRNALRWTVHPERIVLAHCREDVRAGTRLVEFRTGPGVSADFELRAAAPHRCGRDCYDALVKLVDDGFDLHWRITGPRKDEQLRHCYR